MNLAIQAVHLHRRTTRYGMVSAPLRDRFGVVHRLEFYTTADMYKIVNRSARILAIDSGGEGLREIANRARGTPEGRHGC